MQQIEFELEKHPSELDSGGGKKLREVLKRVGVNYYAKLSADDPQDRKLFEYLWGQGAIRLETLNGQRRGLAAFDESLGEKKAQEILSEIGAATEQSKKLHNDFLMQSVMVEAYRKNLASNTSPDAVDGLHETIATQEVAARKAKDRLDASNRKIAELKAELQEASKSYWQRRAATLRPEIEKACERFNRELAAAYKEFWAEANRLLPQVSRAGQGAGEAFVGFIDAAMPSIAHAREGAELKVYPRLRMNKSKIWSEWTEARNA